MNKLLTVIKNLKTKLGKWFWVVLGALVIILIIIFSSNKKAVKVTTVSPSMGDLVETVSTSGTVKADQYSVMTFPTGGLVKWVGVKVGQKVYKGQALAQVDAIILNAAYEQAMNNYRNYQAAAENVLDTVKGNDSDESYAEKATRTAAEVNRDNAYNAVLAARENLRNATLYAPFTGIIDTVNPSSAGVNTLPGGANYSVVNPDSVYFDAEVEETDLPRVSVGQTAKIVLDAYPTETFDGEITNVGLVAFTSSTGGNAYHIRISLPENKDLKFRVGMQGDVEIIFNTVPNVMKISSTTLTSDGELYYVWKVEGGRVKKTMVEIGPESVDETEIRSGLSETDIVVNNPAPSLKDGQKVSS